MFPARRCVGAIALAVLLPVAACSGGVGGKTPVIAPSSSNTVESGTPTASASPSAGGSDTPDTASPTPGSSGSGLSASGTPTPGVTPSQSSTGAPVSCPTVNPVRVSRADTAPRRATEVVTVVSDGTNITSGTREQSDFLTPSLTAPDGATAEDPAAFAKIAKLLAAQKHRVLLERPEAPDAAAEAGKKPYNAPGTYVIYNASSQLTATVAVQCAGTEVLWTFISEADPSTGQVNCAIEPSKSNALARLLYQNNC